MLKAQGLILSFPFKTFETRKLKANYDVYSLFKAAVWGIPLSLRTSVNCVVISHSSASIGRLCKAAERTPVRYPSFLFDSLRQGTQ